MTSVDELQTQEQQQQRREPRTPWQVAQEQKERLYGGRPVQGEQENDAFRV